MNTNKKSPSEQSDGAVQKTEYADLLKQLPSDLARELVAEIERGSPREIIEYLATELLEEHEYRIAERAWRKELRRLFLEQNFIPVGVSREDLKYLNRVAARLRAEERRRQRIGDALWIEKMMREDGS
jgi:hypothetical protein